MSIHFNYYEIEINLNRSIYYILVGDIMIFPTTVQNTKYVVGGFPPAAGTALSTGSGIERLLRWVVRMLKAGRRLYQRFIHSSTITYIILSLAAVKYLRPSLIFPGDIYTKATRACLYVL